MYAVLSTHTETKYSSCPKMETYVPPLGLFKTVVKYKTFCYTQVAGMRCSAAPVKKEM